VTHLPQSHAATACAPCICVGELRDGALLGSGRGKRKAMAAGAQAVPARHAGVAKWGRIQKLEGARAAKQRREGRVDAVS
jgi:hypothetical protein